MDVLIPPTLEDAVGALGGLDKLLTAKAWERAAILAAYVEPDAGHGGKTLKSERLSAKAFAAGFGPDKKQIHGLRSENTVLRYVDAWLAERPAPTPGETVTLPTKQFPVGKTTVQVIGENKNAVTAAIKKDPGLIEKAIAEDPVVAQAAMVAASKKPGTVKKVLASDAFPEAKKAIEKAALDQAVEDNTAMLTKGKQSPHHKQQQNYTVMVEFAKANEHLRGALKTMLHDSDLSDSQKERARFYLEHTVGLANEGIAFLDSGFEGGLDAALDKILNDGGLDT